MSQAEGLSIGQAPAPAEELFALSQGALDLIPIGICISGADGTILRYNRAIAAIWGRLPEPGDMAEHFCGSFELYDMSGRLIERVDAPSALALRTGAPVSDREATIERPDGSRIVALVNCAPILGEAGAVLGTVSTVQDITARKAAEHALRVSEAFLQGVIATTPECIKIVAADGTLVQMNPAGLRMIEAPDEAAVAGACTFDLIAPEHRGAWRGEHARVCQGECRSWEFDIIGMGGTRRHVETHAVPLARPDGSIAQLAVTRDITRRKHGERSLVETEALFRAVLEALPAAIYTTDAEGLITFSNRAATRLWGEPPAQDTLWCGSVRMFTPEGAPLPIEQCPMAQAIREDRPIHGAEAQVERRDGTRVPVQVYPTPIHDAEGRMVAAVNMLVDVSDHKAAAARQRLLINELNHRVKNTLAAVQSLVAQSLRGAASLKAARAAVEQRLLALARTHDILTSEQWGGAGLDALVAGALAAHCPDPRRWSALGPDVHLSPKAALSIAMALHELATNAVKYGALSVPEGRVSVQWEVARAGGEERLRLVWQERDGPRVSAPARRGFGTRLIERGVARELRGEAALEFAPIGLTCTLDVGLAPAAQA